MKRIEVMAVNGMKVSMKLNDIKGLVTEFGKKDYLAIELTTGAKIQVETPAYKLMHDMKCAITEPDKYN